MWNRPILRRAPPPPTADRCPSADWAGRRSADGLAGGRVDVSGARRGLQGGGGGRPSTREKTKSQSHAYVEPETRVSWARVSWARVSRRHLPQAKPRRTRSKSNVLICHRELSKDKRQRLSGCDGKSSPASPPVLFANDFFSLTTLYLHQAQSRNGNRYRRHQPTRGGEAPSC